MRLIHRRSRRQYDLTGADGRRGSGRVYGVYERVSRYPVRDRQAAAGGGYQKTFERSDSVPQCSTSYTKFPIQIYRLLYAAALPTGCRGVLCPNAFWVSQNAIRLCKTGLPHLCPSAAHIARLCHVAISLPYAPSNAVSGVSGAFWCVFCGGV